MKGLLSDRWLECGTDLDACTAIYVQQEYASYAIPPATSVKRISRGVTIRYWIRANHRRIYFTSFSVRLRCAQNGESPLARPERRLRISLVRKIVPLRDDVREISSKKLIVIVVECT